MLADTLKHLHDAENQADNIIAKANQTVQDIEKHTYQQIADLNAAADQAIAAKVAKLKRPAPLPAPQINLEVSTNQIAAAVDYLTKAVFEV